MSVFVCGSSPRRGLRAGKTIGYLDSNRIYPLPNFSIRPIQTCPAFNMQTHVIAAATIQFTVVTGFSANTASGVVYSLALAIFLGVWCMCAVKVREYVDAARSLQRERGSSVIRELMGLLYFRWKSGKGPEIYSFYALYDQDPALWREWVDKAEMNRLQKTINDPEIFYLIDDKYRFYDRCNELGLPTPQMLALLAVDTDGKYREICSAEDMRACLDEWQLQSLVFKRIRGAYGWGFFSVEWDGEQVTDLATGECYDSASFFDLLISIDRPYIAQKKLSPSSELADIMPGGAMGTVRIMTYRHRDDSVTVPYAFVKLPVSGQVNDNFLHGSTGNLLCGIDVASGCMMTAYGVSPGAVTLESHDTHPETGAVIKGRSVPRWQAIVDLCIDAANKFPEFRTVGWDVAVTDDGLYLLEGNRTYDPDGLQVTLRRGVRSEIISLYKS